jgi:hypothetical protein
MKEHRRKEETTRPGIGDAMPDGTIYAGICPDTGKAMYATPDDAPLTKTFNDAAKYAKQLNAQKFLGHDDWRAPTKGELNVLFDNRAAIGGFNQTGALPGGWYWSSTQAGFDGGWGQWFSNGNQDSDDMNGVAALRCVRG